MLFGVEVLFSVARVCVRFPISAFVLCPRRVGAFAEQALCGACFLIAVVRGGREFSVCLSVCNRKGNRCNQTSNKGVYICAKGLSSTWRCIYSAVGK